MTTVAIIAGAELLQTLAGVPQIFNAAAALITPDSVAVVGAPRPSTTRFMADVFMDLNVPDDLVTVFKFILPAAYGNPTAGEVARWEPFCSVSPRTQATAALMVSSQIFVVPLSYDPVTRIVLVGVAAVAGIGVANLALSVDFKHSFI